MLWFSEALQRVLCDGTFVHHLIVNLITPADTALASILRSTVQLYTTRCVLAELKRLGKSYSEALEAARNLIIARCEHDKCVRADSCIIEIVGENNSEHFFVASQDTDLRKKLEEETKGDSKVKRSRKRKRSRKGQISAEAGS